MLEQVTKPVSTPDSNSGLPDSKDSAASPTPHRPGPGNASLEPCDSGQDSPFLVSTCLNEENATCPAQLRKLLRPLVVGRWMFNHQFPRLRGGGRGGGSTLICSICGFPWYQYPHLWPISSYQRALPEHLVGENCPRLALPESVWARFSTPLKLFPKHRSKFRNSKVCHKCIIWLLLSGTKERKICKVTAQETIVRDSRE